jgi:hypothetical protein
MPPLVYDLAWNLSRRLMLTTLEGVQVAEA